MKTMISTETELPELGRPVLVLADGDVYKAVRIIDGVFHMDYINRGGLFRFGYVDYWIYAP